MAQTGGVKPDEELNFILKSLAKRGKDSEIFKKYNEYLIGDFLLPRHLHSESNIAKIDHDHIMLRTYGSSAEDLQFCDPCDAGDIDVMVFSNSDELMIQEEVLEYSLENPLHVRIRGSQHPLLQSCLVEDTEYVATSALKNFSQDIFGTSVPFLVNCISDIAQISSEKAFPFRLETQMKKTANSPALTLSFSRFLGLISKRTDLSKEDSESVSVNEAAAEMECIVHPVLVFKGIDYNREHAEILSNFLEIVKSTRYIAKSVPFLDFCFDIDSRLKTLRIRIQEAESRTKHKTLSNGDQKNDTPEKGDESGRQKNSENCSQVSLFFNGNPVKPRSGNAHADHRSSKLYEISSTIKTDSAIHECPKNPKSKLRQECHDVEGKSKEKRNWDSKVYERQSSTERQSKAKKEEFTWDNGKRNKAQDQKEGNELERRLFRWAELILADQRNEPLGKQSEETEIVKNGIDLIPAFRSYGWPKVAREWIKRERKWPSPDVVKKVLNEGFHLVAKSAKRNGNPDLDFRISFSHAEYLLSQDMNDIQRDCYVCMKKIHRAYLCTQPKSLVSFHLKNILLQTIEETGAEMWNDGNRAGCMMVLLQNLLTVLTKRDLRHFFVRSYNLFGVDYIENLQSLQFLAMKVEEILANPMRFCKPLMQNREEKRQDTKEENVSQKTAPESQQSTPSKPAPEQGNDKLGESPSKNRCAIETKQKNEVASLRTQESCVAGSYRYHDLKDVYQMATKELIEMASHEGEDKVAALDPLKISLVGDLTQLVRNYNIPTGVLPGLFNILWHKRAYYWIWISTDPDIRRRVLVAIQGGLELLKHYLKQDEVLEWKNSETFEAFFDAIFDPAVKIPSRLCHIIPSGNFIQLIYRVANSLRNSSAKDLREMGEKYLDLTHPDVSDVFDLLLDVLFVDRIGNQSDVTHRVLNKFQSIVKSVMVHPTKEDEDQQGDNTNSLEKLCQRVFDFCASVLRSLQVNVTKNAEGIPLD